MSARIHALSISGFLLLLTLAALPLAAAPGGTAIAGIVVDPAGTPQMGATLQIFPEGLLNQSPVRLLTDEHGRFSTAGLPAGFYSIKATLAGFLPAMEQHIRVDGKQAALLQIVLGALFSSFAELRQTNQKSAPDDWTWVLRTSAATRSVLRWQDASIPLDETAPQSEAGSSDADHGRMMVTSGADRPGSIADMPNSPATAFIYDLSLKSEGRLLMAGQFSYEDAMSSVAMASEWLPTGEAGAGPATSVLVRESRLTPQGPIFRGLRISHEDGLAIGDRVSVRYGAELLMAGFNGTTTALRPHAEMAVQIAPTWRTSLIVATRPWQDGGVQSAWQSAADMLDAFPTLLVRNGQPDFENGLHEELSVDHTLSPRTDISAAVYHDSATHTAVIGRSANAIGPDFLQSYLSEAFAYDGGNLDSSGARLAFRQKFCDNLNAAVVYAYAGALAPDGSTVHGDLRSELAMRYFQSVAARASAKLPRFGTEFSAGYKWLNGPAISRQDAYGESLYNLDPYLSMQIRQPLPSSFPCHMELQADVGNLLAQGYVSIATSDGAVVLVPSYRYIRGGVSIQF